jgi:hypothetical protein
MPRIGGLIAAGPQRSKVLRRRSLLSGRNGPVTHATAHETEQTFRLGAKRRRKTLFYPGREPERRDGD